jgi:hypothetical protein
MVPEQTTIIPPLTGFYDPDSMFTALYELRGAFAKLRKTIISFDQSVRMEQLGFQ